MCTSRYPQTFISASKIIVSPPAFASKSLRRMPGCDSNFFFFVTSGTLEGKSAHEDHHTAHHGKPGGQWGGRRGGHGSGKSTSPVGGGGSAKGNTRAELVRPTQSIHVSSPADRAGTGSIFITDFLLPVWQQPIAPRPVASVTTAAQQAKA